MKMNVTHEYSLPLHVNPGGLDPCVGRHWLAFPLTKATIGLWKVSEASSSSSSITSISSSGRIITKDFAVELTGHSKEISALSFSNDHMKYLLSACSEKILLWDLLNVNDGHISNKLFCLVPGEVRSLCMNDNNNFVAASIGFKIFLYKAENYMGSRLCAMEAHKGLITQLAFCPHYSATLVSLSDDRSFCVWDVHDLSLLYRSKVISSSPLISLCMNLANPQVAVGTADGCLKVFDLTNGNNFRQLSNINIFLALQRQYEHENIAEQSINNTMSARPVVVQTRGKQQDLENPVIIQLSESVLSVEYVYFAKECTSPNQTGNKSSGINDILLEKPPQICVITSSSILQINSRTFEIVNVLNLQKPVLSQSFCSSKTIGLLAYAASCQISPSQILAVVGTMFERKIEVIHLQLVEKQWHIDSSKSETSLEVENDTLNKLSIIPASTVFKTSPLMSEMLPHITSGTVTKGDVATGKKKLSNIMNQPLTFKSKIVSSGYAQTPTARMFKPELNNRKSGNIKDQCKSKQENTKVALSKMLNSAYDTNKGPPVDFCDTFEVDHQGSAIFNLRFSDDGNALGCALSNTCALSLKSPYSKHASTCFVGHNNVVNSLFWSTNNGYLITASNDKTALLWNKTGGDPILTLTHHNGTVKDMHSSKINSPLTSKVIPSSASKTKLHMLSCNNSRVESHDSRDNQLFKKEIKYAQFFYLDKFILMTHGNELLLYNYYITTDRDEIKRYRSRNRYKLVANWQTSSSLFTAAAAVNMFYSHLVMCTTSSRNIEVYDLNKSILAHVFSDCHTRPAHSVIINEGSCFTSQQSEAYNVIATAAPTNPIKLWDLRTKSNVQALQGHVNNFHACQIAFSPCGNYLASGSEDRMVYMFDLRKGTYIDCLRGHNEVVTSVAFHPGYQLLASGSLNGKILFFKSV